MRHVGTLPARSAVVWQRAGAANEGPDQAIRNASARAALSPANCRVSDANDALTFELGSSSGGRSPRRACVRSRTGIGETMPKILLTRHGHVEGISPERFRGRSDLSLTEKGLAQAAALGARICGEWRPLAIYTGPLRRCVATGEAISLATGAHCEIL